MSKQELRQLLDREKREQAYKDFASERAAVRQYSASRNDRIEQMYHSIQPQTDDKDAENDKFRQKDGIYLIDKHELVKLINGTEATESVY